MNKPYIYDLSPTELSAWLEEQQEAPYRLRQIRQWLWRGCNSADDMTDLPKGIREKMTESFRFDAMRLKERLQSQEDDTTKYIWQLADGNVIESVFMRYRSGTSVCVSSQAGCKMGCAFCASSMCGFGRNLSSGELIAQVALIAKDQGSRVDHVVVMGIGEPFENYDNLLTFLRNCNDPAGFNISMRRMTVSTCGLLPQMLRFAEEGLPFTLAVSLHAANDRLRSQLMPINHAYPLADLMKACRQYEKTSGRRITFEYALFKGLNDRTEDAEQLAAMLRGSLCHVNLIPANEVPGSDLHRSEPGAVENFARILQSRKIPVTVRRELGTDIMAACGQLRRMSTP